MMKDPILHDLPMPIYVGPLMMRPLMPGDGILMNQAVQESIEHLARWLPWATPTPTPDQSEETARRFYADFILRKMMTLSIWENEQFVGMCGFNTISWNIPSAVAGYWGNARFQGRGLMTHAMRALTIYGFEAMGLRRISLLVNDENVKSCALASRVGYALETRALGLSSEQPGLVMWRRYVRFSADGLKRDDVTW